MFNWIIVLNKAAQPVYYIHLQNFRTFGPIARLRRPPNPVILIASSNGSRTKLTSPNPIARTSSPQHVHSYPPLRILRQLRQLPSKYDHNYRRHRHPHSPQNLLLDRPLHLACEETPPKRTCGLHGRLWQPASLCQHAPTGPSRTSRTAATADLYRKTDVSGKEDRPGTDGVRIYRWLRSRRRAGLALMIVTADL